MDKLQVRNIINWNELSRNLTGCRLSVRKNRRNKKYEKLIADLEAAITKILSDYESKN